MLTPIPPGEGEHPNSSIHEAGNHGGPDRMHNANETFTERTPPAGSMCIYCLERIRYPPNSTLHRCGAAAKSRWAIPRYNPPVTRNESTDTQGWDRDGCDGPFTKIVAIGFVSIIGAAIAGPVGGFFLGAVGNELLNFAENRLDNWISAQLASRVQSLQFSQ